MTSAPLRSALVIGDIHTEVDLLTAALAFAPRAERVLSVGDIVDGTGDPLRCIELLRAFNAGVVRGNHERWVQQGHPFMPFDYPDDALAWIKALPAVRDYETPTGPLRLCHGINHNDMVRLHPDTDGYALECLDDVWKLVRARHFSWMIGGHTHVPMVRTIEGLTFVNPGTLVFDQKPGFMLVDFEARTVEHWELLPSPSLVQTYRVGAE